uniref:Phenoloxidase-activating factor 2 n=1 Tax=Lygus hesperus TaxID=30085 RepID=A0A146KUU1_LYGHE
MKTLYYLAVLSSCLSLIGSTSVRRIRQTTSSNGKPCTCVHYSRCPNVPTDGSGIIQLKFGGVSNPCRTSLEVCCANPSEEPEGGPSKPPVRADCGKRNTGGLVVRIIGAGENDAQFAEFPWMVAILEEVKISNERTKLYECGGSLIHESVVMTAAHCIAQKSQDSIVMRAGEWDTHNLKEPFPHQDRRVAQVIIHENFDKDNLYNDIALLIADEPFVFADNVQTACLPRADEFILDNNCWASGWGQDAFDAKEGRYQMIQKKVGLPMVRRERCEAELREAGNLGPDFVLDESFVCAGGIKNRDTCKGDGGSPLVCPIRGKPSRYQQVGIVSWGIKCGLETPAAYVNVAKFRPWIDQRLRQLNLKPQHIY